MTNKHYIILAAVISFILLLILRHLIYSFKKWRIFSKLKNSKIRETINLNKDKALFSDFRLLISFFRINKYYFSNLDNLGRTRTAFACIGKKGLTKSTRQSLSNKNSTGWQKNTDNSNHLYNRSHLISVELGGINKVVNLITGTRQLNVLMIPFENKIKKFIQNHFSPVIYRVTPIYKGRNLVASGVILEAYSLFDFGKELNINVFIPNRQVNVSINYKSGKATFRRSSKKSK